MIVSVSPSVLALELTAEDLAARRSMQVKQEYQEAIYPLLDAGGYAVVPLEPSGLEAAVLLDAWRNADAAFESQHPEESARVRAHALQVIEDLLVSCHGPLGFNSAETDRRIAEKQAFQYRIYPPIHKQLWDAWNSHFIERIRFAAAGHPQARIAVVVGLEHCYWLRARLAQDPDLRLRHVCEFVAG